MLIKFFGLEATDYANFEQISEISSSEQRSVACEVIQILCNNEEGVLEETSQQQDFDPTVEWTCSLSAISLAVRTVQPFFGIAHTTGKLQNCYVNGTGSIITQFEIPLNGKNKCGVYYNKEKDVYWVQLEVHEHRLLILEQDRLFNVTCDKVAEGTVSGTIGSGFNGFAGDQRLLDATNSSSMVEISSSLDPEIEFTLTLTPSNPSEPDLFNNSISSILPIDEHDVSYGKSYDLKISTKEPDQGIMHAKLFRVHSCFASGVDVSVELVNSHGCSIDKHLLAEFVYEKGVAVSKIPSMFRFPESKTMKLECSVAICQEEFECRPNCDLKLDDPLEGEDADLIAVLKGTPGATTNDMSGEEPTRTSGTQIGVAQAKISTKVHVLDRRELPRSEASPGTANFTKECYTPSDLLIMYKLCIGLCFIFFTGCCCNILFCCVCKTGRKHHQKRSAMPHKSHGSFATTNDLWISEPRGKPSMDESGFVSYGEPHYGDNRRSSLNSYASVKQRATRFHDNIPSHFRLNSAFDSPAHNGFASRPQGMPPSPPVVFRPISNNNYEHTNRTFHSNSVSLESSSDSPDRNSAHYLAVNNGTPPSHKETFSIL